LSSWPTNGVLIQSQLTVSVSHAQHSSTAIAVGVVEMAASQMTRHKCGQVTMGWVT
jgi:predicted ribosome-associated RNA-binding protein Tma20